MGDYFIVSISSDVTLIPNFYHYIEEIYVFYNPHYKIFLPQKYCYRVNAFIHIRYNIFSFSYGMYLNAERVK